MACAFLPSGPGRTCAWSEAAARLGTESRTINLRRKRWSGRPGRTAHRALCLARPRAGHGRPPPGPPRTALPLRSGRQEQLSSGRAKLEGTPGHRDTLLRRGHSPPRPGQKDRGCARCANTATGERGGAGQKPAANQRAFPREGGREDRKKESRRVLGRGRG